MKSVLLSLSMFVTAIMPPAVAAEPALVGADHDAHGCRGSAGQSWSPLRQACIRVFEEGFRLDPKHKRPGATLSAFVIYKQKGDYDGPAELHLPGSNHAIALAQVPGENAGIWHGQGYKLWQWKGMLFLEHGKPARVIYEGPLVP